MLASLITSKTRLKLLLRFFVDPSKGAYLRSLAEEFGESTNSVRVELNRLKEAGLLISENSGKTIVYKANTLSAFYSNLRLLVTQHLGFDVLVVSIVEKLGDVKAAYVCGDYARGLDSGIIALTIVGEVDRVYLDSLVIKSEKLLQRTIDVRVVSGFDPEIMKQEFKDVIVIWG